MDLKAMLTESVPVITLTAGLSQRAKLALNIDDQKAELLALAIALLLTVLLDYATLAPATPQDWVLVVIHGLVNGVTTSGGYKLASAIAQKGQTPPA
jgi:hypothetical protein